MSQDGMFILSGICMQLVFIGESVKTIDNKTNHSYLIKYTDNKIISHNKNEPTTKSNNLVVGF